MTIELTHNLGNVHGTAAQTTVTLSWRERQRSRLAVILDDGEPAVILLSRSGPMQPGDLLSSDEGQLVKVQSTAEEILEVRAETGFVLIRLVYHLANRHAPAMLTHDAVYIEPDPILAELARHLGGIVTRVRRPFEPERGAYHGANRHNHPHPGEIEDEDRTFGNIGEALSRAAHAR
jgi:urease accessory protein